MEDIQTYREAIRACMLQMLAMEERPRLSEKEANARLDELRDDELRDGILFNTPEEVATLLLED